MDGARTRGHDVALATVDAMLRHGVPHAILVTGPGGVGKTTLAEDLAAALLCQSSDFAARPCRACRGCRLVEHAGHPDLHRLRPEGPGGQIVIGGKDGTPRGVRDLIADLALLPMEGGSRVAILESAHRMNEDAQAAILKTLEEPPDGVTIILCADDEDRLLPTVRSRCARMRLGPVGSRDIESILGERGLADPPLAARLGRLAGGRPGLAIAYALAPDALRARGELARTILDLLDLGPAARLAAIREATPIAQAFAMALEAGSIAARQDGPPAEVDVPSTRRRRGPKTARVASMAPPAPSDADDATPDDEAPEASAKSVPVAQRRRAAEAMVSIWADVARDLAIVAAGGAESIRDPDLLEEAQAAVAALPAGASADALRRVERAGMLLAANASPELVLDGLALAWPRRHRAA